MPRGCKFSLNVLQLMCIVIKVESLIVCACFVAEFVVISEVCEIFRGYYTPKQPFVFRYHTTKTKP